MGDTVRLRSIAAATRRPAESVATRPTSARQSDIDRARARPRVDSPRVVLDHSSALRRTCIASSRLPCPTRKAEREQQPEQHTRSAGERRQRADRRSLADCPSAVHSPRSPSIAINSNGRQPRPEHSRGRENEGRAKRDGAKQRLRAWSFSRARQRTCIAVSPDETTAISMMIIVGNCLSCLCATLRCWTRLKRTTTHRRSASVPGPPHRSNAQLDLVRV
jgi:hypothetical protein